MKIIDLTQFSNAITSLKSILERYNRDRNDIDIRDGVIKRFEYTYSTAVKMIYRYLRYSAPEIEDTLSFNEAIRMASKAGILLTNLETWDIFRKKRNITSHIYDETAIAEIIDMIPTFIKDADFLYTKLNKFNSYD